MYGLRGPSGQTAVLQLTYELRPKWCNNKSNNKSNNNNNKTTIAKMPFLGRTLCRGPTNMKQIDTSLV